MPLHPVRLPKSANQMFRIVVLQKRLLKALADPALHPAAVDTVWLQHVWKEMDAEWVRKFCLGGQESILPPIKAIAGADVAAREALYGEFCRQNKVPRMLAGGGDFTDLRDLPGFSAGLATSVKKVLKRFYTMLSHKTRQQWTGYMFSGGRCITNLIYKNDFCADYPTRTVCPYCDGEIGTPELDHYYSKDGFPLLACSPWNLVPVCRSCNDMVTAKGDRPAMALGPPRCTDDWLHPFFRPASTGAHIRLSGSPPEFIPQLHSPDAAERKRLTNHTALVKTLSKRWTNYSAAYFDRLVREVTRRISEARPLESIVAERLEDHLDSRGRSASAMVQAAVCQAVLDGRPEYVEEFAAPNAPSFA